MLCWVVSGWESLAHLESMLKMEKGPLPFNWYGNRLTLHSNPSLTKGIEYVFIRLVWDEADKKKDGDGNEGCSKKEKEKKEEQETMMHVIKKNYYDARGSV